MCGSGRQLQAAQGLQGRRQPRPRLIWAAVSAVLCYRVQHASDSMKAALPRAHTSGAVSISTATGSAWSISTIIATEFLACGHACSGVRFLRHAAGLQDQCLMIVPAPVVVAADSDVYAR